MHMPQHLSDREIDELLYKLRERLDFKERAHIKEMLKSARKGGGLYRDELKKELYKLRAAYKISSGDADAIMRTVFVE